MKKLLLLVAAMCISMAAFSQEDFTPSGKPVLKVFTNWHQGFGDALYEDNSGFEVARAVFGYSYKFSPNMYTKLVIDTDNPKSGKLTEVAYLRNAYVGYKDSRLNVLFGVLGMKQFKEQENNWGYRYIYKSAMDHYKFNNSVDLGLYAKYKFVDWLAADVTISNGEGAKKQQDLEGKYRLGLGLSLAPVEGLSFRAYYDYFWASEDVAANKDQDMLALFMGYEGSFFRIGAEVDMLRNYSFDEIDDRTIYSAYASLDVNDKMQAFGRYDILSAEAVLKTEAVLMAGVEYDIVKGVKVSPNVRFVDYVDTNQQDGGYFYLNFEYKF